MTAGQVRELVDIAPSIQIQRTQLLSPPRGPDPRSIIQYRGATAPRRGPRRAPAHGASAERQQEKRTRERDRGGAAQRMPLKRSPRPTPAVRLPPLQRSPDKDRSPRVAPAGAGVLEDGLSMKRSVSPENVRPPSGDGVCRPGARSVLQGGRRPHCRRRKNQPKRRSRGRDRGDPRRSDWRSRRERRGCSSRRRRRRGTRQTTWQLLERRWWRASAWPTARRCTSGRPGGNAGCLQGAAPLCAAFGAGRAPEHLLGDILATFESGPDERRVGGGSRPRRGCPRGIFRSRRSKTS